MGSKNQSLIYNYSQRSTCAIYNAGLCKFRRADSLQRKGNTSVRRHSKSPIKLYDMAAAWVLQVRHAMDNRQGEKSLYLGRSNWLRSWAAVTQWEQLGDPLDT